MVGGFVLWTRKFGLEFMKQCWNVSGWVNVGFKFLRLEWVLFDCRIKPV